MGEINNNEIQPTIDNVGAWLSYEINNIDNYSIKEFMLLLIITTQFLYAICAKNNIVEPIKGKYRVFATSVKKLFNSQEFSEYAESLVNTRNLICHNFNSEECKSSVAKLYTNRKVIIALLNSCEIKKYLPTLVSNNGSEDTLSKAINSMSCK
jgi:hypothetical protein